jgi:hypothetical protein
MEGSNQKRTCEERINEELKGRLEQLLPEVENWSRSKCQSWLKAEGNQTGQAGPAELRETVLEHITNSTDRSRSRSVAVTLCWR